MVPSGEAGITLRDDAGGSNSVPFEEWPVRRAPPNASGGRSVARPQVVDVGGRRPPLGPGDPAVVTSCHGASLAVALPSALLGSTAVAWRRRAPLAAVAASDRRGHRMVADVGRPRLGRRVPGAPDPLHGRVERNVVAPCPPTGGRGAGGPGRVRGHCGRIGHVSARSAVASIALPLVVGPALAGYLVARRRSIAGSLRMAVEQLRAEEEARLGRGGVRERNRVARDMHDVVAHGVSAMVVQAGAARTVLDDAPELAQAALEEVVRTGGVALADLGRIVGTLDAARRAAGVAARRGRRRARSGGRPAPGGPARAAAGGRRPANTWSERPMKPSTGWWRSP